MNKPIEFGSPPVRGARCSLVLVRIELHCLAVGKKKDEPGVNRGVLGSCFLTTARLRMRYDDLLQFALSSLKAAMSLLRVPNEILVHIFDQLGSSLLTKMWADSQSANAGSNSLFQHASSSLPCRKSLYDVL